MARDDVFSKAIILCLTECKVLRLATVSDWMKSKNKCVGAREITYDIS